MSNITLLHYNNYFNRTIKKLATVAEYQAVDANNNKLTGINFVPGDGVMTSLILGTYSLNMGYDYLLVSEMELVNNVSTEVIKSRWFILQEERTRDGQYEVQLRRDVIADHYDEVMSAPTFIEKAYIDDVNNPLLYNSENMSFNQIKQQELPLKDETKSGWVVGYIPSNSFSSETPVTKKVAIGLNPNITVTALNEWSYWDYCTNKAGYKYLGDAAGRKQVTIPVKDMYITAGGRSATAHLRTEKVTFFTNSSDNAVLNVIQTGSVTSTSSGFNYPTWFTNFTDVTYQGTGSGWMSSNEANEAIANIKNNATFNGYVNSLLGADLDIGNTDNIRALDGQTILDQTTGQYYKIKVISASIGNPIRATTDTVAGTNIINFINSNLDRSLGSGLISGSIRNNYVSGEIELALSSEAYAIQLENAGNEVEVKIDSDRSHLNDSPYDMFCIPYSDELKLTTGEEGSSPFTVSKNVAVGIATAIGTKLTQGMYDIQLLPYCPSRALVLGSADKTTLELQNVKYDLIYDTTTDNPVSAVIWCTDSNFSIELNVDDISMHFGAPYRDLPSVSSGSRFRTETYYALPSIPTLSVARSAIGTTSINGIRVMKVDKIDGHIISEDWYNTFEIYGPEDGDKICVYKYGNWQNPEIEMSVSAYNSASYFFVLWTQNTGIGSQWIDVFCDMIKIPTVSGLGFVASNSALERKVSNECDMYRLVSGNYNGIFEFSVAKSNGIEGFIADCTYKPWAPYIHIIPKLKGLYGESFVDMDDARGLICGGDFSLPQLSDAWSNYVLQNKTYQEMFDRQIKNMDVTNEINRQGLLAQAIMAPITGASGGALAGAAAGPYGAIAGAVVGAVGGSITAGLDYTNQLKLMEENRQYAIDMYGYNLQNIQAIPNSITKTSALTYNTRVWPFVELYTCTDVERQALKDKIEYNGMTIMTIGRLQNYKTSTDVHFFKGQVIRLPSLNSDSHMAYAIYEEINKGVYL